MSDRNKFEGTFSYFKETDDRQDLDFVSLPRPLISTSSDPKLFAKFVQYMGTQSPFFVSGSRMTYLISGPGGIF